MISQWTKKPLFSPIYKSDFAWTCPGYVALQPSSYGWMIFAEDCLLPKLSLSTGEVLDSWLTLNGSFALSGPSGATLAYYPTVGWCLRLDGLFKSPHYYEDFDGSIVGDDYYRASSTTYSPDRIVSRITRTNMPTITFKPYGPNEDNLNNITGTWIWPRLCPSSNNTGDTPVGEYTDATEGWSGPSAIFIGDAEWNAGARGEFKVSLDGSICGPARRRNDGTWIIGTEGIGVWYTCPTDLAAVTEGTTATFTPASLDDDVVLPTAETWTCNGRVNGGATITILVADTARWI